METKSTGILTTGAWRAAAALTVLACVGAMGGCRGERTEKRPRQFLPDMDDSPKWKPQVKSEFFEDLRTMRPTVPGTVAFGDTEHTDDRGRGRYLKADDAFYTGITEYAANGDPVYVPTIPVAGLEGWPAGAREGESGADLLARREAFMGSVIQHGQERFNIYCAACHGYAGDGQGMVGQRWAAPVANFHDPKYVDTSAPQGLDGYIFNVIRHGVPFPNKANEALRMPSYAHAVTEADAWAIIAYMRVLQESRVNIDQVPPAVREELRNRPKPASKVVPEAEQAPGAAPGTAPAGDAAGEAGGPATPSNNVPVQGGGNQ